MRNRRDQLHVEGRDFTIIRYLGEGKDCLFYQVSDGKDLYFMKEYVSGKEEAFTSYEESIKAYELLKELGIMIPKLIVADAESGIQIRECIDGENASSLILNGSLEPLYLDQLRMMAEKAEKAGYCLDYFPTGFAVKDHKLYYLRYICKPYEEKECFDQLVGKYWLNRAGLYNSLRDKR